MRVDIFASDTFKNAFKTYNPVQQNVTQTVLLMDGLSDKQLRPPNSIRLAKCALYMTTNCVNLVNRQHITASPDTKGNKGYMRTLKYHQACMLAPVNCDFILIIVLLSTLKPRPANNNMDTLKI